jgi:hypothetical protein
LKAFCHLRADPVYRREAFAHGLKAAGYEVHHCPPRDVEPGDVLVLWNRYAETHDAACRFEKAGGVVLVAENGYLGVDRNNRRRYALAQSGHNGSGFWYVGGPERFAALGVELKPWRQTGEHILVCPNRSFGMPGLAMPPNWAQDVAKRLKKYTAREIRIRPHPGNDAPKKPLAQDIANAWAVVIWSSSAGVDALVEGIPVVCESPWWIAKRCTGKIDSLDVAAECYASLRLQAFQSLAWAQWHVDEIAAGMPFEYLCKKPVGCHGLG